MTLHMSMREIILLLLTGIGLLHEILRRFQKPGAWKELAALSLVMLHEVHHNSGEAMASRSRAKVLRTLMRHLVHGRHDMYLAG